MRHEVPHCSNCAEVMTTAPNVIPRSKATWESPKRNANTVAVATSYFCSSSTKVERREL